MILSPIFEHVKVTGADMVEVAPWIQRIEEDQIKEIQERCRPCLQQAQFPGFW